MGAVAWSDPCHAVSHLHPREDTKLQGSGLKTWPFQVYDRNQKVIFDPTVQGTNDPGICFSMANLARHPEQ
jgi:hypothetical protein